MAKKYKTVSGYLRANEHRLHRNMPEDPDRRREAVESVQRDILCNLLPQLGLPITLIKEKPIETIERLLAAGGTDLQIKALKDCKRWLKDCVVAACMRSTGIASYRSGGASVTTPRGPVSYHVSGFKRDDHNVRVNVIVDIDGLDGGGKKFEIAQAIAGPDYCFHVSSNINPVPDDVKNRLLTNEELFAVVPELAPRPQRVARR